MAEERGECKSSGSSNPWSSTDLLLGVQLSDPRSGVVVGRRCGLQVPSDNVRSKGLIVVVSAYFSFQEKVERCISVNLTSSLQKISSLLQNLHEVGSLTKQMR